MTEKNGFNEAKLRLLLQMNRTINDYAEGGLDKTQTLIFMEDLYAKLKTLVESHERN